MLRNSKFEFEYQKYQRNFIVIKQNIMELEEIIKRLRSSEDKKAETNKIIEEFTDVFKTRDMRMSVKIQGELRKIKKDKSNADVIFFLDYIFDNLK